MPGGRILVVDDEAIVAENIRSKLEGLGYEVCAVAPSGEEAVREAERKGPDLVLMDIRLRGEMDGVEAALEIGDRFDIPIVYLTAYADERTLARAKIANPYGYILKPFGVRELNSIIEIALYKHEVERKLSSAERWLTATLQSVAEGLLAVDGKGQVALMNPVAETLTGWRRDEALGRDADEVFKLVARESGRAVESPLDRSMRQDRPVAAADGGALLISRNGFEAPVDYSAAPIKDERGRVVGGVLVFTDVTDRRRAETSMLAASRLDATATLAGGIAHDFNNMMLAVLGNAEILRLKLGPETEEGRLVGQIVTAAQRSADLAQQMLAFARGGKYRPRVLDLNLLVEETLRQELKEIPTRIRPEHDLQPRLWPVRADAQQMSQVLMALYENAVEAIAGRGRVRVRTRNLEAPESPAGLRYVAGSNKRWVCLSVTDNGCGMDEETLSMIYEPFFTTKFQGRGMGLAAAYGIVRNHGGSIAAESSLGRGATFSVWLPAVEAEAPAPKEETRLRAAEGERVLVVDDEEMVLSVTEMLLRELGYEALRARSGLEALAVVQEATEPIHAVLLDLAMPEMGGAETFPLLRDHAPDAKIVVCSGYDLDERAQDLLDSGAAGFLRKPFGIRELGAALRKALDR